MKQDAKALDPASWLVAAGRNSLPGASLNVPLVPASNYVLGGERGYAREDATPTWEALEQLVGGLEGGEAVAFASGMAAVAAVFHPLAHGSLVVLPDDCYQGVASLAEEGRQQGHWSVERLKVEDTEAWVRAAGAADLIWLESPSNPLLRIADLATICAAPRRPGGVLAVDNTFATPLNQRPLELGADVSVHSATKFIGGHSDLLGGVAVARQPNLVEGLRHARTLTGATPGALEAYLAVRGLRTMALRVERAQSTAGLLAERLEAHPEVERTRYPGLASHPGHELAEQQLRGFGTMISFDLQGGARRADAFCTSATLIRHATSLGSVESTMERRGAVPGQEHLPPSMIRLSVGIEDPEDLWRDLEQALARSVDSSQFG